MSLNWTEIGFMHCGKYILEQLTRKYFILFEIFDLLQYELYSIWVDNNHLILLVSARRGRGQGGGQWAHQGGAPGAGEAQVEAEGIVEKG